MTITKSEIKKGLSIIILAIGFGLVDEPIREFVVKTFSSINPIFIGLGILAVGAYLFDIK